MPETSDNKFCPPVISERMAWCVLGVLLVVTVPLFVCSPVTSDTSLFDVQAMTVMKGGTLYRDVLEPNLPGIVWVHLAIRSMVGWSSEAIRVIDLVLFACTMVTLSQLVSSRKGTHRLWGAGSFVLISSLFYLSRNEWCHCQRDTWMLVPIGIALLLRHRRKGSGGLSAVAEGIAWGIAFWIKPHVAIPATAVMVADSLRFSTWTQRTADFCLVICGGMIAAIPGIVWLIKSGAWPHFWHMMLEWNPEYLASGRARQSWHRLILMFRRFYPWMFVHAVAVPVAVMQLSELHSRMSRRPDSGSRASDAGIILSACYLAWLTQTFLIQHAMDYIHVPEVILAIAVIAARPWHTGLPVRRFAVAALVVLALPVLPHLHNGRLVLWPRCFMEGSSPEMRSVLAQGRFPDWQNLNRVKQFLSSQNAADFEVTCLNVHSIHLHQELGILPATRYWSVTHPLTMYPSRYKQIMASVDNSRHQFVVVDDIEMSQRNQILPENFPGQSPMVFTAGDYHVHAVPRHHVVTSETDSTCQAARRTVVGDAL